MRRTLNKLLKPIRNQRGVALLIAVFAVGILTFIALEVSYETNVEYIVASQQVNRIKAYYAAKAGVEISLLRILLYKQAVSKFGKSLGSNTAMLDPIWQFPFAWPPSKFLPKDSLSIVAKDQIESAEKESSFDATYITSISSEGGRIDINDLGSGIESLSKNVAVQLNKIFEIQLENNDDFRDKYSSYNFEELLNNIADWVDADTESRNGGDEKAGYDDVDSDFIPPNQPFRTLEELNMVAGMTTEIYDLLASRITVFGIKGININYSNADTLKTLDAQITDEVASEILKRRNNPELGGLFSGEEDFLNFLGTFINTADFNEGGVPLLFDPVYNFRIESTGEYNRAVSEITAVTYDIDNLTSRMVEILDAEDEKNSEKDPDDPVDPDEGSGDTKKESKKTLVPKGQPRIVYWHET